MSDFFLTAFVGFVSGVLGALCTVVLLIWLMGRGSEELLETRDPFECESDDWDGF